MDKKHFAINVPLNSVSFGQVSFGILRELHKLGYEPAIFPIGDNDFSSQELSAEFQLWLQSCLHKAYSTHKRSTQLFKLWHFNGSLESFSDKQVLFTFYELDSPTPNETNVAKNSHKILLSSNYAKNVLDDVGCDNTHFVPLAFDHHNFFVKDKAPYAPDGRIRFIVVGKYEMRKHHARIIQLWIKRYGNNPKYSLDCAVYNPFFSPQQNQEIMIQLLGNKPFNVNLLGFMPTNKLYNDFLNSANIVLGMSGGEGWGLPEFHAVALGAYGVILNAHAYKEWATGDNSVLVRPSGKMDSTDNVFFKKGAPFNQGNFYTWNDEDFLSACDLAISKVENNRVNTNGLELQKKFPLDQLVNNILTHLD